MQLGILKIKGTLKKHAELWSNCGLFYTSSLKSMLALEAKDLVDEKTFQRFMEKNGLNQEEKNELLKIYQIKKTKNKDLILMAAQLRNINELLEGDFTRFKIFFKSRNILSALSKLNRPYFEKLGKIGVALGSNNLILAKSLIKKLMKEDGQIYFYEIPSLSLSNLNTHLEYHAQFVKYLKNLEKKLEDDELFTFFKVYLSNFFEISKYLPLTRPSSNDLKKLAFSYNFGIPYPYTWFPQLHAKSDMETIREYLNIIDRYGAKERLIWSFSFSFLDDKKVNDEMVEELGRMLQNLSSFEYSVGLKILNNLPIKELLSKKDQKYKKPLFLLKRKYYKAQLIENSAYLLSLYQLLDLGENMNFFWWMVL